MPSFPDPVTHTVTVPDSQAGERLDKALAALLPELSRSRVQGLIAEARVTCDGITVAEGAQKVKAGEVYAVAVPPLTEAHIAPVNLPLTVVYEDAHLLVIDKAAGMTVHPAPGHYDDTLVNALLYHYGKSLSGVGGVARPGIVHRLDKDTSGLMVVAKTDAAHRHLARQLEHHTLGRTYRALVWGVPPAEAGTVEAPLARSTHNRQKMAVVKGSGKHAITHYEVEEVLGDGQVSLVKCTLETGRTHQIRVHMAHIGHPVLGDPVYGGGWRTKAKKLPKEAQALLEALNRQALHAAKLSFRHPETGAIKTFRASLPAEVQKLISAFQ